jgi:class 3 adenylate cyclase
VKKKILQSLTIAIPLLLLFSWVLKERTDNRFHPSWGTTAVSSFFNSLEYLWYDMKFKNKTPEVAPDVLVARIDDPSLERFGRWPWSRAVYAKILDSLYGLGAKVVGFDAVFSEPEFKKEYLLSTFTEAIPGTSQPLAQEIQLNESHIAGLTENLPKVGDLIFGSAVFRHPETVLGYFWQHKDSCATYDPMNPEHLKEYPSALSIGEARKAGRLHIDSLVDSFTILESQAVLPESLPVLTPENCALNLFHCPTTNTGGLSAKAKIQGYFNSAPDSDGVFRRSLPLVGMNPALLNPENAGFLPETWFKQGVLFPSLALQTVISYWNDPNQLPKPEIVTDLDNKGRIFVKAIRIPRKDKEPLEVPTLPDGSFPLNFFGSQEVLAKFTDSEGKTKWVKRPSIGEFSLAELPLGDETEAEKIATANVGNLKDKTFRTLYNLDMGEQPLKNKIVIIGPTALGVYDLRPNPVQSNAGGVFLHATAVGRILQRALDPGSPLLLKFIDFKYSLIVIWTLGIVLALLLAVLPAIKGAITSFSGLLVFLGADYYLFTRHLWVLDTMTVCVALLLVFFGIFAYKYFTEERERAFVKGAFEKYVSPDVVGSILEDPKKLNLGGQKKELSVMFSDVRGFTTISERMGAAELAKFMNDYLSPMTDVVLANKGTIDKYMGDAIMAIFGAPIEYPNHAQKAVDAALEMMTKLQELKVGWVQQGLPPVDIGIGINTGEMSVGNMGSTRIFSYTVMGDSVNLGSRLEGINKEYATHIIVSEFTRAQLPPEYLCRELDRVKVKGKLKPVTIFEVVVKNPTDQQRLAVQKFEAALALYYNQNFLEAQVMFKGLAPTDPTAEIYVERCVYWTDHPPETGWDGSWTMKTK